MILLTNLVLEITKKCNFSCAHCLRGDAKNEEINLDVLPKIFNKDTIIQNLELTGGEVFFNPKLLNHLVEYIINSGVNIANLSVITNGTCYTKEIDRILKKLDLYLKKCQLISFNRLLGDTIGIELSIDKFHQDEMERIKNINYNLYKKYKYNISLLLESKYFDTYRENEKIINLGRAKNLKIKKYEPAEFEICYTENGLINNALQVSGVEVNIDGEVKYTNGENLLKKDLKDIIKEHGRNCKNELEFEKEYEKCLKKVLNLKESKDM